MIQSFVDKTTEQLWDRERVKHLSIDLQKAAYRMLQQLSAAESINDLRVPLGNRLEKLVGDRAGQHSIRINDQYRICFRWTKNGPKDVELVDYH